MKKTKIANYLKTGILFVSVSLLLWNCEKNDILEEESYFKTVSISESLDFLNSKMSLNAKGTNSLELDIDIDAAKHESINNSNEEITVIPAATKYNDIYSRVVLMRINDTIKTVMVNMYATDRTKKFTGRVSITQLNGDFIRGYTVKNGNLNTMLVKLDAKTNLKSKTSSDDGCVDFTSPFYGDNCIDLGEVDLGTTQTKDRNAYMEIFGEGNYWDENYDPIEWEFDNDNGNGGSNNGFCGYGYEIKDGTCVKKVQIFDKDLTGKAKCLNDSLTKNGNNFVKDILSNFQGESKFDINIESKNKVYNNKGEEVNGLTRYAKGNKIVYIDINSSKFLTSPSLAGIRTLIHEYIHADMYRKINTKNYDGDLDFKKTYEYFKNGNFKPSSQHESMAKLYINQMKNALKNIHGKLIPREVSSYKNRYGDQFLNDIYESLAWQGLRTHNLQAWKDKGTDTTKVNNILDNYVSGLTKEFCK